MQLATQLYSYIVQLCLIVSGFSYLYNYSYTYNANNLVFAIIFVLWKMQLVAIAILYSQLYIIIGDCIPQGPYFRVLLLELLHSSFASEAPICANYSRRLRLADFNSTVTFIPLFQLGCVNFASKIIEMIGRQKQRAKCWHNRSKFQQNMFNYIISYNNYAFQ